MTNEFARADTVVGFTDTDVDGVKVGTSYDRDILALEFYFQGGRHTIWLGLASGVVVIERDEGEVEIWRGNLKGASREISG
jgi:L-aminopeptidase/D-esterase-like protein